MNIDTLAGEGTNLTGRIKESLGDALDDPALRQDGASDQIAGNVRKAFGGLKDFVRERPVVSAAVALVAGMFMARGMRRRRTA